jgi:hypothetical protein
MVNWDVVDRNELQEPRAERVDAAVIVAESLMTIHR